MTEYRNLSGQSNVAAYENGEDFIIVKFKIPSRDGSTTYKYTYASAGQANIGQMKRFAEQGSGLNSFININVRKNYEGNPW